jgi:hypothetical protein
MHINLELDVSTSGIISLDLSDGAYDTTLYFYTHGTRRLYDSSTAAIVTVVVNPTGIALLMSLACDLHDPKLGDGEDIVLCLVVRHGGFHSLVDLALIPLVFHIDEVDDDKTSEVAKS